MFSKTFVVLEEVVLFCFQAKTTKSSY